nr:exopolysaccharide Pel transporter PelG [Tissierella sp.]
MAGIGFELKKIFIKDKMSSSVKGFTYASIVTAGPMIVNLLMISIIGRILLRAGASLKHLELFYASMTYSYIFSLLNVSGIVMIISRYASDKIYINNTKNILASMIGSIAICVGTGAVAGFIFYIYSPLPVVFKLFSYMIFIELSIINILMVYISAVKDYKKVALSFALGLVTTIVIGMVLKSLGLEILTSMMLGLTIGYFVNIFFLLVVIKKFFNVITDKTFEFIKYVKKMPLLFFINLLFTGGLFGHNIIFWLWSDLSVKAMGTYLIAPAYDTATFYAVITIIPSLVVFVVKTETSFYEKYKEFGQAILNGGTFRDIKNTKKSMVLVLRNQLSLIVKLQLIITVLSVMIGGNIILANIGYDSMTIKLFVLLAIGYFFTYMTFILITVLLYFDNQEDAFKIALMFFSFTVIFTSITIFVGEMTYGFGLSIAAFLSMSYGGVLLLKTLEDVDYRIFTKMTYYE